ncbi:MAG: hypothetical protein RMJ43_13350 [Chloroherpetonaceae bacterium]|nr:hypothetical protein [Chloroherpetonaceae bacterium]
MDSSLLLADVVEVRSRFLRSVHLERDYAFPDGYHPTASTYQGLQALVRALDYPADRAMTLIGPYGAGKSAFCVQLARLLEGCTDLPWLQMAEHRNAAMVQRLQRDRRPFLPVLLVGSRRPLAPSLTAALMQSLQHRGHGRLLQRLQAEALRCPVPSSRRMADFC